MLVAREIPIAPDPLALAARLRAEGAACVALLLAADRTGPFGRFSYVACDPDRATACLDPLDDDPELPSVGATGPLGAAPRWIGVVPYEARRALERPGWSRPEGRPAPLLEATRWLRYPAVAVVDHREGRVLVVGTAREAVDVLAARLRGGRRAIGIGADAPFGIDVADGEPPELHIERVAAAKALIARGELYQVNLARRLLVALRQGSPLDLCRRLAVAAPSPFAACLDLGDDRHVVSTSPELLLHAEPARRPENRSAVIGSGASFMSFREEGARGEVQREDSRSISRAFARLFTCPIKGTRPRGRDAAEDAALVRELDQDPKEIAELTMIIDVERHDLGRVAETGSVRILRGPEVVTHRTVHHREALLVARARPGVSRNEVLASMLPSGSVTGAPKVRAMEVIARLEAHRRGLYTGGFGHVAHDGTVTLAMAIRTVVLRGDEGEYFTGGGIVADSDPARELEETRWKAVQLERAARRGGV